MPVVISQGVIKDIAQNLEMGMKCWYHIPAAKVIWLPDDLKHAGFEKELWEDAYKEIDHKKHECVAFECLDTHEEFRIMESFAENEVNDKRLRASLITALSNRKPFRHFKFTIDNSNYREAWFAYRLQWYKEHVQQELDWYNRKGEDDKAYEDDE